MTSVKTIFVTGVTGNQGGAVAESLIKKGFRVKGLTRKPGSARAQSLVSHKVELVEGDLNNASSFRNHLEGVDGIFSVQTFINGTDVEIKQGMELADLAKEYNVGHFLYSSVAGADWNTGIPHFESKLKIENYIRQIGLPFTIIRPNSLFENFLIPEVKSRILKGKLASPVNKDAVQQFISAHDVGVFGASVFLNKEGYLGKTLTIGVEQLDMQQVARIFSEILGTEIKYQKLPMLIVRLIMGKDLYKMFKWVNRNNAIFMRDLETFRQENPNLISFREWIKVNFKPGSQVS